MSSIRLYPTQKTFTYLIEFWNLMRERGAPPSPARALRNCRPPITFVMPRLAMARPIALASTVLMAAVLNVSGFAE